MHNPHVGHEFRLMSSGKKRLCSVYDDSDQYMLLINDCRFKSYYVKDTSFNAKLFVFSHVLDEQDKALELVHLFRDDKSYKDHIKIGWLLGYERENVERFANDYCADSTIIGIKEYCDRLWG